MFAGYGGEGVVVAANALQRAGASAGSFVRGRGGGGSNRTGSGGAAPRRLAAAAARSREGL